MTNAEIINVLAKYTYAESSTVAAAMTDAIHIINDKSDSDLKGFDRGFDSGADMLYEILNQNISEIAYIGLRDDLSTGEKAEALFDMVAAWLFKYLEIIKKGDCNG